MDGLQSEIQYDSVENLLQLLSPFILEPILYLMINCQGGVQIPSCQSSTKFTKLCSCSYVPQNCYLCGLCSSKSNTPSAGMFWLQSLSASQTIYHQLRNPLYSAKYMRLRLVCLCWDLFGFAWARRARRSYRYFKRSY